MGMQTKVPAGWFEPVLHTVYMHRLLQFADAPADAAERFNGIVPTLHSFLEVRALFDHFRTAYGVVEGMEFGQTLTPSVHGLMGQAVVASDNLAESLAVLAKFSPIRNRLFLYGWRAGLNNGVLTIEARFDQGRYAGFTHSATLFTFVEAMAMLQGRASLGKMRLEAPWNSHDCRVVAEKTGLGTVAAAPRGPMRLTIPNELLVRPNVTRDRRQYNLACNGSQDELALLEGTVISRVKAVLVAENGVWPSQTETAARIGMSARTMTRRLADEGSSFQKVLDGIRADLACWYLRNDDSPIATIALSLGYCDETNFARTFRRWKGVSPNRYRNGI